ENHLDINHVGAQQYLAERVRAMSGAIASRTLNIVGGVLGVIVEIFFVIFTMFYLFRDGEQLRSGLRQLMPLDLWASHEIFLRTREVIQASVYGSLVIATLQGVLGAAAFAVLEIPSPLLWGVVMILTCMIPMIGSVLGWGPATLYLVATGHYYKALILVIWCAAGVSTVDNVPRP